MARFYGEVGNASRTGTYSGLSGHIRGWHVGGQVRMWADGEDDACSIYITGGSAGYGMHLLGEATPSANGVVFTPSKSLRDAILKAEGKGPVADVPTSFLL